MLDDGSTHVLGEFDGRYLPAEVAGGFTGRVLGVEALTGSVTVRPVLRATTPRAG